MTTDTVGGVWTYALELCEALAMDDIQVLLATMGAPLTRTQREEAASLSNLQIAESTFRLEWMAEPWRDVEAAGQWLLKLERQFQPDIVHLNSYAHGAMEFRAPRLVTAHSCVLSWWRAVKGTDAPAEWREYAQRVSRGLGSAHLVVAPTNAMLNAAHQHYGPLSTARVIYNGRNPHRFPPGPKEPMILSAGRLWDEAKNVAALVHAAPQLPWPVVVAGDLSGPHDIAARPSNLRFLGHMATAQLAGIYARAAIYAAPARYEPFGLCILEAALAGCALVLGDIPSLRELWDGAALFVPPADPDALRDCLLQIIHAPERRKEIAAVARNRAITLHPGHLLSSYRSAYMDILPVAPLSHARNHIQSIDGRPVHPGLNRAVQALEQHIAP